MDTCTCIFKFISLVGIEVQYQIALQIALLLMTLTETATTSGLQTFFQQDSFLGIPMNPTTALALSSAWSLKTSFMLHLKTVKVQKGFFGFKAKFCVAAWGLMGSLRRILSINSFFVPSLGLFNILNHWLAEQYPFGIRKEYNRIHRLDEIQLFNQTGPILWSDIDRWNYYGDLNEPTSPSYSLYTGLTLKWSFIMFFVLMFFHFVSMMLVKTFTSLEFKEKGNYYDKFLHGMENINCAFPFRDWDEDDGKCTTKEEFKRRVHNTEVEMMWSQLVNFALSMIMLMPIWFTGKKISGKYK